jgi:hypothetical protein
MASRMKARLFRCRISLFAATVIMASPGAGAEARIAAALATRNVGDFAGCKLELIDRWA